jgi:hypothetical protein
MARKSTAGEEKNDAEVAKSNESAARKTVRHRKIKSKQRERRRRSQPAAQN